MDLTNRISADIIRALSDNQLQKLNKLLDNDDVSEEQIKTILDESEVDVAKTIKKTVRGE